ncbi:cyclodeaminase/cyclohydrolase family protein [Microbacterium sp. NE2HP2]|uniref:cyclodeaminase/cyclohydrolase family protein n=1 Tax=Microbacterium TaxID=33882 RepID=UPI002365B372|nr:cyclodeaminase/cyclohydrolase family protein [Microbacterium plantarum]MDD7943306.1 cyclodeaminase/cyclohydrolase family protein [Microbacterium plantarum]WRK18460.1 cyclodeaminase/cyclohydrolase family protein [Microbacterium plantarum]
MSSRVALGDLLDALARDNGDPGGGAASGVVTAVAAALAQMVSRYSSAEPAADGIDDRLARHRDAAISAADDDGRASGALGAALRPDDDPGERDRRIVDAATRAIETSAALGEIALGVWDEVRLLADVGNRHLMSDVAVAADTVAAGLGGAAANLRGGLALLRAHGDASALESAHDGLSDRLIAGRREARALADRLGEP